MGKPAANCVKHGRSLQLAVSALAFGPRIGSCSLPCAQGCAREGNWFWVSFVTVRFYHVRGAWPSLTLRTMSEPQSTAEKLADRLIPVPAYGTARRKNRCEKASALVMVKSAPASAGKKSRANAVHPVLLAKLLLASQRCDR